MGGQVNATLMFSAYVGARNLAELGEEKKELALKAIELMKAGKLKPSGAHPRQRTLRVVRLAARSRQP